MTRTLTRSDVTTALRGLRRLGPGPMEIACPAVDAIAFRDLLELYLVLTGAGNARWRDGEGRVEKRQPLRRIVGNLLRDLWGAPAQILRQRRRARAVIADLGPALRLGPDAGTPRAIFLRSDHWFGVRSGGSVGHIRGVIEGLRRLGVATEIVATDRLAGVPADAQFHLCRPIYGAGRNVPGAPELAYNDTMTSFVAARWDRWRPSFIYQRLSLCNFTGAELRRRYRVPYVCEYNGSAAWMARHWDRQPLLLEGTALAIEKVALCSADLIVVVSAASRDELIGRGLSAERILVNSNGVDPDIYNPAVDGSGIRQRYGVTGETVIGFIGTFGKWHGAEVLARAFARLLAEKPALRGDVRLLMIGDGLTRPETERALHEAGAADRAIFTGLVPQEEGPAYLAACDILVSPHVPNPDGTPFFGSPTKLFEYMAMGRAIVASQLDQIDEILQQEETALLVRPGSEAALADALSRLIADAGLRARLGAAARRKAVAEHCWTAHVQRILIRLGWKP